MVCQGSSQRKTCSFINVSVKTSIVHIFHSLQPKTFQEKVKTNLTEHKMFVTSGFDVKRKHPSSIT